MEIILIRLLGSTVFKTNPTREENGESILVSVDLIKLFPPPRTEILFTKKKMTFLIIL